MHNNEQKTLQVREYKFFINLHVHSVYTSFKTEIYPFLALLSIGLIY